MTAIIPEQSTHLYAYLAPGPDQQPVLRIAAGAQGIEVEGVTATDVRNLAFTLLDIWRDLDPCECDLCRARQRGL